MVYIGTTERHFQTRQNEHLSGKNNSEIGFHQHAPKRSNFVILGRYKYPFTAESLHICNENIKNLMNTRLRSNKIEIFVHGNTLTQLRNRSMATWLRLIHTSPFTLSSWHTHFLPVSYVRFIWRNWFKSYYFYSCLKMTGFCRNASKTSKFALLLFLQLL